MQHASLEGSLHPGYGFISSFSFGGKLSSYHPKNPLPLLAACTQFAHTSVPQHRFHASRTTFPATMGILKSPQGYPPPSDCLAEQHLHAEEGIVCDLLEKPSAENYLPAEKGICRRAMLIAVAAMACLGSEAQNAHAVKQIQLAGRIPGLSPPDENGLRTYQRPEAKSGGHGVGWSPITPYSFQVSEDWDEVPVSIADLGGTEIDLRFSSQQQGNLSIVVAPVLRFASSLGDDARIEDIGTPEKVIYAFGPELIGQNVEGKVKDMEVSEHRGRKYYQFELDGPHTLVKATAAGNRLYIMTVSANGLQWKKHSQELKQIADSFRVG